MKCCSVDVDMLAAALIHVKTWTKVSAEIVLVHNLQKCKQSSPHTQHIKHKETNDEGQKGTKQHADTPCHGSNIYRDGHIKLLVI